MWYSPSLQQLLYLEAVLEEGNVVRAADRLHTTHSTISRSLKALSNGLGIDLFDKTPRGLKPSNVGRVYGVQIRSSLEQAKLAFDLARYETNLHQRPFCVGHSPYIHGSLLPLLEQLTLPGSEAPSILLRSAPTTRLVWRVLRGELQAGFGVLPIVDKALWIERIAYEPFSVCLAEHHRLAIKSRLAARELSNETLVWIPRSIHRLFYDEIVNYLLTLKFDPRRFLEAHTITQALDFAAHGAAVALVPRSASRFQRSGVLFKPLTDELIRIETALFVRRDQMRAAIKEFVAVALPAIAALKLNPLAR
ncbi:MAG TPA: LysR family transcriptional regulator [Terracidiphilus sp.]|nr:LysR family transcriptional regulator [Terracidiphilus sp.]